MNASVSTLSAPSAANTKPLWAAVSVLGVAVVALGASLVYVQSRPVDGHAALATLGADAQTAVAPFATVPVPDTLGPREDLVAPPTRQAPVAVVKPPGTRPVARVAQAPAPMAERAPAST